MAASPSTSPRAIEVFYSYAHLDERLRTELDKHLSSLRRHGVIAGWHDRRIMAGTEWAGAIDAHLQRAQIILLLVSADFLASNYCYDIELQRAMARHAAGALHNKPGLHNKVRGCTISYLINGGLSRHASASCFLLTRRQVHRALPSLAYVSLQPDALMPMYLESPVQSHVSAHLATKGLRLPRWLANRIDNAQIQARAIAYLHGFHEILIPPTGTPHPSRCHTQRYNSCVRLKHRPSLRG
jgi:hypothetical protein